MTYIKKGDLRINLEQVLYISKSNFKRRYEDLGGEVKDIYTVNFYGTHKNPIPVEFFSEVERDDFMSKIDIEISIIDP